MKKKLPVVTVAERDEAARLAELPAEATVALQDLAGAIKDGLMAFCCSAGLAVVSEIMADGDDREGRAQGAPRSRPRRHEKRLGTGLGRARRAHRARPSSPGDEDRGGRGAPRLLRRFQRSGPAQPARRRAHAGRRGDAAPRPGRRADRRRARRRRPGRLQVGGLATLRGGDHREAGRAAGARPLGSRRGGAHDRRHHVPRVLLRGGPAHHRRRDQDPRRGVGGRHREHDGGQAPAGRPGGTGTALTRTASSW